MAELKVYFDEEIHAKFKGKCAFDHTDMQNKIVEMVKDYIKEFL